MRKWQGRYTTGPGTGAWPTPFCLREGAGRLPLLLVLQVLTVVLVAVAVALAPCRALVRPARERLSEDRVQTVQAFHVLGRATERVALLLTLLLLVLTPFGSTAYWLTAAASLGLLAMQAVYWLATRPRAARLDDSALDGVSAGAASFDPFERAEPAGEPARGRLRRRWGRWIALRALLGLASLVLLVTAAALDGGGDQGVG